MTRPVPGRRRPGVRPPGPGRVARLVRGLSGALTGGLVVLAVVMGGAAVVAGRTGSPGPTTAVLWSHGLVALVAVAVQVWADRRVDQSRVDHRGDRRAALLATAATVGLTAALLAVHWYS